MNEIDTTDNADLIEKRFPHDDNPFQIDASLKSKNIHEKTTTTSLFIHPSISEPGKDCDENLKLQTVHETQPSAAKATLEYFL